ncbi:uncharacterized protein LOC127830988 [Dreissena polymorpha]|uniref:Uncharacterized protein n=1 Tax=Dreissena polymorpha TaxID=45954 RepID=A0A9D4GTI8_DREPO|nr:uncharacterized protein LOC127830988 [Dreissena polymorpha]KAH3823149.1 hypothetical protein DPMN_124948 [Dreissena polymorpha]
MEAVVFDSLEKANEYIREEEIRHNAKYIVKYSKTMDPNKHIDLKTVQIHFEDLTTDFKEQYTGVPFINLGMQWKVCEYGYALMKKEKLKNDEQRIRKRSVESKKRGCKAMVKIKMRVFLPRFKVENGSYKRSFRDKAVKLLREAEMQPEDKLLKVSLIFSGEHCDHSQSLSKDMADTTFVSEITDRDVKSDGTGVSEPMDEEQKQMVLLRWRERRELQLKKLFDYIDKDPKELKAGEEDVNRLLVTHGLGEHCNLFSEHNILYTYQLVNLTETQISSWGIGQEVVNMIMKLIGEIAKRKVVIKDETSDDLTSGDDEEDEIAEINDVLEDNDMNGLKLDTAENIKEPSPKRAKVVSTITQDTVKSKTKSTGVEPLPQTLVNTDQFPSHCNPALGITQSTIYTENVVINHSKTIPGFQEVTKHTYKHVCRIDVTLDSMETYIQPVPTFRPKPPKKKQPLKQEINGNVCNV